MKKKENLMPTWNYENITFKIKLSDHNPPHVHAEADGKAVLLVLENSNAFAGELKPKDLKKAQDWVLANKKMFQREWEKIHGKASK